MPERPNALDHLAWAAEYTLEARQWWARLAELAFEPDAPAICAQYHAGIERCLAAASRHLWAARGDA